MCLSCYLAWAKAAWVVGGHHSGQGVEGDLLDHQSLRLPLLQQTCTREAGMLVVAELHGDGAETPAKAWAAARSSATSGQGYCCGKDSVPSQGALGRHLKLAAGGCWSAVRARDVCVRSARGSMGHWRFDARAVHYCGGR